MTSGQWKQELVGIMSASFMDPNNLASLGLVDGNLGNVNFQERLVVFTDFVMHLMRMLPY